MQTTWKLPIEHFTLELIGDFCQAGMDVKLHCKDWEESRDEYFFQDDIDMIKDWINSGSSDTFLFDIDDDFTLAMEPTEAGTFAFELFDADGESIAFSNGFYRNLFTDWFILATNL